MVVSRTRKATMYSLSRCSIASQEARIANGIRKVVSRTNGIEKPSTPSLKRIVSASQAWVSTSWKAGLAGSNRPQAQSDKRNVATVVNSAAQRQDQEAGEDAEAEHQCPPPGPPTVR